MLWSCQFLGEELLLLAGPRWGGDSAWPTTPRRRGTHGPAEHLCAGPALKKSPWKHQNPGFRCVPHPPVCVNASLLLSPLLSPPSFSLSDFVSAAESIAQQRGLSAGAAARALSSLSSPAGSLCSPFLPAHLILTFARKLRSCSEATVMRAAQKSTLLCEFVFPERQRTVKQHQVQAAD